MKKFQTVMAIVVMFLAVLYVARPEGFVPLFDAGLNRLAMTEQEGYCAGRAWLNDAATAADCRATDSHSTDIDLRTVVPAFCNAIVGEIGITQETCENIFAVNAMWPLYDGGFTDEWSESAPYPGSILGDGPIPEDTGRTGGRDGLQRMEEG